MATVSHSESRRLYSWWWDSHISPKTSKWLQENLTDMDAKVKAMIKLIEEDADSFARRAEMYYKKRPELMKLVEEFYRAYRALAERYDCATVELRQVHKTMAEAFPNQVPFMLAESSPSDSSPSGTEPQTPEMPHPIRALLDPDELHDDALGLSSAYVRTLRSNETCTDDSRFKISKKRLRQISGGKIPLGMPEDLAVADGKEQSCQYEPPLLSNGNQNLPVVAESDHKSKTESHEHTLKEALAEIKAEKEALFIQYQKSIERLAILDRELNHAQDDVRTFSERAYKAENEVRTLREVLVTLEAERDAGILQLKTSSKKISDLETVLSLSQRDTEVLKERAIKAEAEAQSWKLELSRLEGEKEAAILQYTQCLEKVTSLEDKILHAEAEARKLFEQADRAEMEVKVLKQALTDSNEEKEATAVQYKKCLESISKMESELACAHSDAERLNSEILVGMNKLKDSEEHCIELEKSNQSLQLEVDNVAKKMVMKDQELLEKHEELVKLQVCVQYEHSRLLQAEGTLQTLQNMHSQSQEDHRALVWEVQNGLQLLKDSEKCKQELEREIQRINRENQSLNDLNLSSSILIRDMQNEAFNLRKTKGKHEEKVAEQLDQIKTLQRDIYHLKEEIKSLNRRYQALLDQLESVGLNPESLALSVKALQDEIANLKDFCKRDRDEKDDLLRKLEEMGILSEKNSVLERSLIDLTSELEGARQNTKSLQESYQILRGEKSNLVAEKSSLFSQLLISSENMQELLEKNSRMEESLCASNIKLEGLREKSKGLEESCHLLNNEKSSLLTERETLVSQLEIVEERLGNLEKKLTVLEESYAGLEKEKEFRIHQVDELHASLATEKQERADFMFSSETRFVGLENQMHLLQKESISRQKEFEEELDRAVDAQVEIFILKKCVHDMEENNFSLMMECHKYIETTKLSEKIISELEIENLEQQVELEFLLDEIEKLKTGIYNIFKALQTDSELEFKKDIKVEQTIVPQINRNIKNMKSSLLRIENEKQQLSVENTVLFTLIEELRLEGGKLDSENKAINQEFKCLELEFGAVQNDKIALQDLNEQLNMEVKKHDQQEKSLKTERGELIEKLVSLQEDNHELQKGNSKAIEENKYLLKGLSELKQDICLLEEENGNILLEAIFLGNLSLIYNCFRTEKTTELDALAENIDILNWTNSDLRNDVKVFEKKMEIKEIENYHLMDSIEKLKTELYETKCLNVQLNHQVVAADDLLSYKHKTFSEVEEKLKCAQNLNLELCSTLEGMEREHWESELTREILVVQLLDISKHGSDQHKVIECLREVNKSLETEMMVLHRQIDECKLREENLSSELQEKSSEFELWEAEASKFYFDLQISTVREVLFEDKVHELTSVCVVVEAETASKSADLVHMKERVGSLEGELGGLRMQLSAYDASIYSLKDNIASLENNFLLCKSQCLRNDQKDVEVIAYVHGQNCNHHEDQSVEVTDGISDLKNMQARIKAVEEELKKLPTQVDIDTNVKLEAAMNEIEELKSSRFYQTKSSQEGRSLEDVFHGDFDLQETELGRNKILMKDISLDRVSSCSFLRESKEGNAGVDDQMLALWETDEQDKRAPVAHDTQNQEVLMKPQFEDIEQETGNAAAGVELEQDLSIDKEEVSTRVVESRVDENERNILERLAADAQKLQSLHITVQELKRKMEANKKSKKRKVIDYETMEEQLQETEDVVSELVDINAQLTKNIEETPSSSNRRDSAELEQAGRADISEMALKGSEKIGRLQLEVQKIQYVLLKLDDEKKKSSRSSEIRINRSTALFKGLIYSGGKSDGRKKKGCFCGCLRPSSPDGNQGNHI